LRNPGSWFDRLTMSGSICRRPELDRALDPNEADGIMVQMVTFLSAELPTLPMYFNYHVTAHVGSLRGPAAVAPFSTPYANIHQWEWQ